MDIIFATHNDNKAKEVNQILHDTPWSIFTLRDIDYHDEIIESGNTLKANAWIKADQIFQKTGRNVMADDTGLEVDYLDNAPGVYSARYAGPQRSNEDNMTKLLSALEGHDNRAAQFRTIVACYVNGKKYECEGIIRGRIALERQGDKGFGYDPIFIPEGYSNSFGVLDASIKNEISHRSRAFRNFRDLLNSL